MPFSHTPTLFALANGALTANSPNGGTSGGSARGANSVDLQTSRISAGAVASGQFSTVVGGYNNTAGGIGCVAGGFANGTTGLGGIALGYGIVLTGQYSAAFGAQCADRGRLGALTFASGSISVSGDSQIGSFVVRGTSTSTAALRLTTDSGAANAANCINITDNSAFHVVVNLVGIDKTASGGTFTGTTVGFLLSRATGAASTTVTALIGGPNNAYYGGFGTGASFNSGNASLTFAADTTNGGLNISVIPPNADTWHWVARVTTVEVI